MEQWVQVQVNVPAERLGSFHEMFGRWLQVDVDGSDVRASKQPVGKVGGAGPFQLRDEGWRTGPMEQRLRDAQRLYRSLAPGAQEILDFWIEHPGERIPAEDLARAVGAESSRVIAGRLSTFGFKNEAREPKDGGRGLPFHWTARPAPESSLYWMESDVAELFREARQGPSPSTSRPSASID